MKTKIYVLIVLLLATISVFAEIQLPAIFSDGMVLQQETKVPIWGWAHEEGTSVKVVFSNQTKFTKSDTDGKWTLSLDRLKASSKPSELCITVGLETKVIKNVLVGEVWFCSGQSNMDVTLSGLTKRMALKCEESKPILDYLIQEMDEAKDPLFRQIAVPRNALARKEKNNFKGSWIECSPRTNSEFSATAYFFGRELRKELGVPVAIIKCAYGGTRVQPWIPMQAYRKTKAFSKYYQENIQKMKNDLEQWDSVKSELEYKNKLEKWKEESAKSEKDNKINKPKVPQNPINDKGVASGIYNAMVNPLVPYAIKGVIWYQGEANIRSSPEKYSNYFTLLIQSWREIWGQGDFPFYFTQLATFPMLYRPAEQHEQWSVICDQQRLSLKERNTGMAVLHDIGETEDIHPKNKIDVGKRLALLALVNDYGKEDIICSGPLFKGSVTNGDKVIITFNSEGHGLMAGKKVLLNPVVEVQEPLRGFQICGADRVWKQAEAKIIDKNKVEVSHPEVINPVEVRYAWTKDVIEANLYNKDGLPASIFKTAQ